MAKDIEKKNTPEDFLKELSELKEKVNSSLKENQEKQERPMKQELSALKKEILKNKDKAKEGVDVMGLVDEIEKLEKLDKAAKAKEQYQEGRVIKKTVATKSGKNIFNIIFNGGEKELTLMPSTEESNKGREESVGVVEKIIRGLFPKRIAERLIR